MFCSDEKTLVTGLGFLSKHKGETESKYSQPKLLEGLHRVEWGVWIPLQDFHLVGVIDKVASDQLVE